MVRSALALFTVTAIGCTAATTAPAEGPPEPTALAPIETAEPAETAAPTTAPPEAALGTRYRVGDYVIYEFSGSALKAPVTITEDIIGQDGLRLEIQVTAERSAEERTWVQVVTDTRENRQNEKFDALYLVKDGKREKLVNADNVDTYRLYEWIIPPMEGPLKDKQQAPCKVEIAGKSYELTCTTGKATVGGKEADIELCDGEAFLWTQASSTMRAIDGGELLYQKRVKEAGRR